MSKPKNNPLPHLIRYFREKKNYSQEQLANLLCISRSAYASYESGRVMPSIQHIVKLSQILEHDFLFAYALSVQHESINDAIPNAVYEDAPYTAVPKTYDPYYKMASDIEQLEPEEQNLLKAYLKIRIEQQKKNAEITSEDTKEN